MQADQLNWERLTRYAMKILAQRNIPRPLCEDMAQEAVITIFAQLDRYDPSRGASVYTWAYMKMNQFIAGKKRQWWRTKQKEEHLRTTPSFAALICQHWDRLNPLLKPAERRVADVYLHNGDIPYTDIAEFARIRSAGSVRVHVCKIRKHLNSIGKKVN